LQEAFFANKKKELREGKGVRKLALSLVPFGQNGTCLDIKWSANRIAITATSN